MQDVIKEAAQAVWAFARPILTKVLGGIIALALVYLLIFKVLIPGVGSIFTGIFSKEPATKVELQEKIATQKTTINELQLANASKDQSIKELQGASTISDNAVNDLLNARGESKEVFDKTADKYQTTISSLNVEKALVKQNTRTLVEKKANQKLLGEDTTQTEKMIQQSKVAERALEKKQAQEVINSIWETYENAKTS